MENLIFSEEQLDLFENTLPPETDEKGCDSFGDLVYIASEESCQIILSSLSEEQGRFLKDKLKFDTVFRHEQEETILYYNSINKDWLYTIKGAEKVVSFNDIFIHKDDLE